MTQAFLPLVLVAFLASCSQYREPRANCYNFAAATKDADPCEFHLLGGPDGAEAIDV